MLHIPFHHRFSLFLKEEKIANRLDLQGNVSSLCISFDKCCGLLNGHFTSDLTEVQYNKTPRLIVY